MSTKSDSQPANEMDAQHHSDRPIIYQIRVEGYLDCQWVERFGEVTIVLEENGDTLLTIPVVDQAALFGLLRKIRDLGISLASVVRLDTTRADVTEDVNQ